VRATAAEAPGAPLGGRARPDGRARPGRRAGPDQRSGPEPLPRPHELSHPDGLADGIARLRRALRRGARVADPGNPLAVAQLELLSALVENPGNRPGQLAHLLHMRPNTVTTIVNALTAQGMVSRVAADDDRRAIRLTATPAGQDAVRAWQATNAGVLRVALATLPAQQRRALTAAVPALDALAWAVDQLADGPAPTSGALPAAQ